MMLVLTTTPTTTIVQNKQQQQQKQIDFKWPKRSPSGTVLLMMVLAKTTGTQKLNKTDTLRYILKSTSDRPIPLNEDKY